MESLGSKIMFVGKHWKWFLALWAGFKLLPLLGGLAKLTTKLGFIGPAAAPAAGPMLALGAAALMVGAGVGLAALGLAELVKSFKGMEWDEFQMMALGITILSGALWLLVGALAGMANPLSWVGVAAIGAVGLAAGGISKLIGFFKKDKYNMEDMGAVFDSYGEVNTEQLEAGMAAFESMKDSINEMSGKKLGALAILAPAMAISAMVSPRSTPTPAAGGQSGTQRIRNEITITLEGRQLQSFVEETVGAVVGNAALGNG